MRALFSVLISAVLALGVAGTSTHASAQETELPRLREAARTSPRDATVQRSLGIALLRAGRYREARTQLDRAARLQRGSLEALFDVARVSFAERDHRGSESACRAMARVQKAAPLTRVCDARSDRSLTALSSPMRSFSQAALCASTGSMTRSHRSPKLASEHLRRR